MAFAIDKELYICSTGKANTVDAQITLSGKSRKIEL